VTGTRDTRCMSWVRRSRETRSRHRGGGDRHAEQDRERLTQLAVSAERNRIAREMHDIVAHNLSVMIALTDGAALTVERDPARARAAIHQAAATGRAALAEMRNTFTLLRSGPDDDTDPSLHPEPNLADLDAFVDEHVLSPFDHRSLQEEVPAFQEAVPTTENLCVEIFKRLRLFPTAKLEAVRVEETSNNSFEYAGNEQGMTP